MNTVSSKRFDPIDLYHQMLFGVRTDCNYQDYWLLADSKQKILEKSNMFATHAKFGDTDKPGALHTMTEFLNDTYSLTITEHFCEYFSAVCDAKRPVDTKESWLMYSFFDACEKAKITVDSAYIQTVADTLNTVMGGKFDVIKFMNYGTNAYNEWFRNVISTTGTLQGIQRPEKKIGNVYLHAVLEKHTSLELPVPQPSWTPYPQHII
jgi:hypothetical protein